MGLGLHCVPGSQSTWRWGSLTSYSLFHSFINHQVITDLFPYPEAPGEPQIIVAILNKQPPGDVDRLLPRNFEETDPTSASALTFLHSTLPHCWDFQPRRRPSIRTLLLHISEFSSGMVAGADKSEVAISSGSKEEALIPKALQDPPRGSADRGEEFEGAGWVDVRASDVKQHDQILTRHEATVEELLRRFIRPDRLRILEHSDLGVGNYGKVVLGVLDEDSSTARGVAIKKLKARGALGRLAKVSNK